MYPDNLLIFMLPLALYAALTLVPRRLGLRTAGAAVGLAAVFFLVSVNAPFDPSFNFDTLFQSLFAAGLLGGAVGGLVYHRMTRRREPSWIWRAVGLLVGFGVTAGLVLVVGSAGL